MNQEQRLEAFRQLIATRLKEQLTERMGIRVTEIHYDRVVGTMPVRGNQQPYGLLHGGASCVLAETLGSVAAALRAFPEGRIACVDINATHHRPVSRGLVTGVCTPLHEGRSFASHQIVLTDDEGLLVCTARLTCAILRSVHFNHLAIDRSTSTAEE
jgi:1,4-dihydroxy-2-naphthoyl-CoA hydrolase